MSTRETPWEAGTPSWADLMTPDRQGSWAFYSAVLGWEIQDSGPEMGHYGMASVDGKMVAGIGEPPDPAQAPPPTWTTYLATDDLDATLAAATANGGSVAAPAMDVGDAGRLAVVVDPTGAFVGLWQAKDFVGAERVNEPGGMAWNQVVSRDPDAARAFYSALFGFTYTRLEGAGDFTTIDGAGPGSTVGGIGGMENLPDEVPPHWQVYFQVADADDTVSRVTAHGGSVVVPAFDTPFGRMACVADPHGASFWVAGVPAAQG